MATTSFLGRLKARLARHMRAARQGERDLFETVITEYSQPPIRSEYKFLIYALFWPVHKVSGFLYYHFRAPRTGTVRVQIGPGKRSYFEGWINLDGNLFTSKCDVWVNFHNPLPFHDNTVDALYSFMVIEHLRDLFFHFREIHRVLKPGGVFRIGGPHADNAIRKFLEGDMAWFTEFPDKRNSIGGRFENFIFCREEHRTITTFSFLEEIAKAAGFKELKVGRVCTQTNYPEIFDAHILGTEYESDQEFPHAIVIEARKE